MKIKYPLSLYIVGHPKFTQGKTIANDLYSIFCRDIKQPLARGLGIPVYYRFISSETKPVPIDCSNSDKNAIILLIDEHYFLDEGLKEYTRGLIELVSEKTRIFPVALFKDAHEIGYGLKSLQFIRTDEGDISKKKDLTNAINKIKIELLHDCARLMIGIQPSWKDKKGNRIPSPVTLFLSHAKIDGQEMAKKFKNFVDSDLKLEVFFDTVDIADGYEFEKQIESSIKNSALVVFHTDEYSSREWCRIEVLIAKRNKCPIVVVHDIKIGEKRAFPYLGNTPTITIKRDETKSFQEIINLTLCQVLNNLYQMELLKSFKKWFHIKDSEFISLSSPPELFNYLDIYKKKKDSKRQLVILYPEPPLGAEELHVLNEIDQKIKFITPILLPTLRQ